MDAPSQAGSPVVPGRGTGSHEVTVRVPATSANLGPGYDCLGLCLDLWDEVSVSTLDGRGVEIDVTGEGEHTIARDESHLVIATIRRALADLGHPDPRCGLMLHAHNRIAQSRGLGSSAAAIVAGLALGWGIARPGQPLDRDWALGVATQIEGHPDNAAPAIFGGAQLSWLDGDSASAADVISHASGARESISVSAVHHVDLEIDPRIHPVVFVPQRRVPTSAARAVMPHSVPHDDAVRQVLSACLLVTSLSHHPEHLMAATQDWLHQPFRRDLMPESADLIDQLRACGVPAVISGAGSTVLALGTTDQLAGVAGADTRDFAVHQVGFGAGVQLHA